MTTTKKQLKTQHVQETNHQRTPHAETIATANKYLHQLQPHQATANNNHSASSVQALPRIKTLGEIASQALVPTPVKIKEEIPEHV